MHRICHRLRIKYDTGVYQYILLLFIYFSLQNYIWSAMEINILHYDMNRKFIN